jgi:DNA-binding MarR family transcriptional regulator
MKDALPTIDPQQAAIANTAQLQGLYALALENLTARPVTRDLKTFASSLAEVVGAWRTGLTELEPTGTSLVWWYVGHLECLLAVVRMALSQRLPAAAEAVLRRKRVPSLLRLLRQGDRTLSELADKAGMDLSHVDREVNRMAAAQLVHTSKEARKRWVGLTAIGSTALQQLQETRRAASKARIERTLEATAETLASLLQRQQSVEQSLAHVRTSLSSPSPSELSLGVSPASHVSATMPSVARTGSRRPRPNQGLPIYLGLKGFADPAAPENPLIIPELGTSEPKSQPKLFRVMELGEDEVHGFMQITVDGEVNFYKGDALVTSTPSFHVPTTRMPGMMVNPAKPGGMRVRLTGADAVKER